MEGCRQADREALPDIPADVAFTDLPAYLVQVLAALRIERARDEAEWACIEGL